MKNFFRSIYAVLLFAVVSLMNFLSFFANWQPCNFAVTQNPVTGRMRGKFANAVFSKQFGLNVMRSKPLSVSNPRTAAQKLQRGKLAACLPFARTILTIINVGLRKAAIGMSPFNMFLSDMMKNVIGGTLDNFTFSWSDCIISSGELYGAPDMSAASASGKVVTISFSDNSGTSNALATDKLFAVAFNSIGSLATFSLGDTDRSEEGVDLTCTNLTVGNKVEVFGFFTSANGSLISDSQYLGQITLLS